MPPTQTIGTLFLLAPSVTNLKGSFLVYAPKNFSQLTCFEERCNEKVRIIIKIQTQGRTHIERETQKCQHFATWTNCFLWTQEGVWKTSKSSNQHIQTLEGYFADLMVISLYPEATETGTKTAKVFKKRRGNCVSLEMSWLWNCLFSWSGKPFLPHCCRFYCLTLEMKNRTLRWEDWAVLRGQGIWKYSSQHSCVPS